MKLTAELNEKIVATSPEKTEATAQTDTELSEAQLEEASGGMQSGSPYLPDPVEWV